MANGDEYYLDGGIHSETDNTRTDFYLIESGPGQGPAAGVPLSLELSISTGNSVYGLVEIPPEDLERIGKWFIEVGQMIVDREKKAKEPT